MVSSIMNGHPLSPTARSTSHGPLAQVAFALQDTVQMQQGAMDQGRFARLGLELVPFEVSGQTSKYDLTLMLTVLGEGLLGTLEYSTDLFERDRVLERSIAMLEIDVQRRQGG